jgi:hypothetical protein
MRFIYDVTYYTLVLVIIAIIMLAYRFSHQPPELKGLVYVLMFSLGCDLLTEFLYYVKNFNNIGGTIYGTINPMLFSYFFYHCLRWPKWRRPLILVNLILLIFFVYNGLFLQKVAINSYSAILGHLLILFLSICYYYKLLKELPTSRIQDLPLFWIISAFFFTYSGKLVLMMVTNYMVTVLNDNLMVLWTLHNGLSALGLIILIRGAWLANSAQRTTAVARNS